MNKIHYYTILHIAGGLHVMHIYVSKASAKTRGSLA